MVSFPDYGTARGFDHIYSEVYLRLVIPGRTSLKHISVPKSSVRSLIVDDASTRYFGEPVNFSWFGISSVTQKVISILISTALLVCHYVLQLPKYVEHMVSGLRH